ncbi:hypothetical protein ACWH9X_26105, partial [Paenibacillus terrae]
QVLSGEKINWGSVAKDAGLGFVTVGVLDSKVGKAIGGFAEKVGSKVTPQWIGKGVDAVGAGFGKAVNKLEQAGSKLGQKFNEQLSKMADGFAPGSWQQPTERQFQRFRTLIRWIADHFHRRMCRRITTRS